MSEVANWVGELAVNQDDGDIALGGQVLAANATFAQAFTNGDVVWYAIIDGDNREAGFGTFDAGGNTIARTPQSKFEAGVYSNGTPSALVLSGNAEVYCTFNKGTYDEFIEAIALNTAANGSLVADIAANTADIATLSGRVDATEARLDATETATSDNANSIFDHEGRISILESQNLFVYQYDVDTLLGTLENGAIIYCNSATNVILTMDASLNQGYNIGVIQEGAGQVIIELADGGESIDGHARSGGIDTSMAVIQKTSGVWKLSGTTAP